MKVGLYQLLANSTTLTALVPASAVYLIKLPDDYPVSQLPAITLMIVAGSSTLALDRTEIRRATLQVDIWSNDPSVQMEAIQSAVHGLLSGYSGTLSDNTRILSIEASNTIDGFETDARIFRSINEFLILFT